MYLQRTALLPCLIVFAYETTRAKLAEMIVEAKKK